MERNQDKGCEAKKQREFDCSGPLPEISEGEQAKRRQANQQTSADLGGRVGTGRYSRDGDAADEDRSEQGN